MKTEYEKSLMNCFGIGFENVCDDICLAELDNDS